MYNPETNYSYPEEIQKELTAKMVRIVEEFMLDRLFAQLNQE